MYDYRNDPILSDALAFWLARRGARTMPRKSDLDPVEMPPRLLPQLQIIEPIADGRFRFRLVGTAAVEAYGRDYTGRCPDEMFTPDRAAFIQRIYRTACETRRPVFSRNKYITTKNVDLIANRLYLPLSDDDATVDFILGVLTFDYGTEVLTGIWGRARITEAAAQHLETLDPPALAAPGVVPQ
jgi:hypothetical protein